MNGSSKQLLAIMRPVISTAGCVCDQRVRRATTAPRTKPTTVNNAEYSGHTASTAVICTVDSVVKIGRGQADGEGQPGEEVAVPVLGDPEPAERSRRRNRAAPAGS
jgi:hypothetical protein